MGVCCTKPVEDSDVLGSRKSGTSSQVQAPTKDSAEYDNTVAQIVQNFNTQLPPEDVLNNNCSTIVMISHHGTEAHRKALMAGALQPLLTAFHRVQSSSTRDGIIRAISQMTRCSRGESQRLTATQNPEMMAFVLDILKSRLDKNHVFVLMHTCDLLRYLLASDEDRAVGVKADCVGLLSTVVSFTTTLDGDNDLVKSAFQVMLALGPAGENGVFEAITSAMTQYFFFSSVLTPALASLLTVSTSPIAAHKIFKSGIIGIIQKAVEVHKENQNMRIYSKRIAANTSHHVSSASPHSGDGADDVTGAAGVGVGLGSGAGGRNGVNSGGAHLPVHGGAMGDGDGDGDGDGEGEGDASPRDRALTQNMSTAQQGMSPVNVSSVQFSASGNPTVSGTQHARGTTGVTAAGGVRVGLNGVVGGQAGSGNHLDDVDGLVRDNSGAGVGVGIGVGTGAGTSAGRDRADTGDRDRDRDRELADVSGDDVPPSAPTFSRESTSFANAYMASGAAPPHARVMSTKLRTSMGAGSGAGVVSGAGAGVSDDVKLAEGHDDDVGVADVNVDIDVMNPVSGATAAATEKKIHSSTYEFKSPALPLPLTASARGSAAAAKSPASLTNKAELPALPPIPTPSPSSGAYPNAITNANANANANASASARSRSISNAATGGGGADEDTVSRMVPSIAGATTGGAGGGGAEDEDVSGIAARVNSRTAFGTAGHEATMSYSQSMTLPLPKPAASPNKADPISTPLTKPRRGGADAVEDDSENDA